MSKRQDEAQERDICFRDWFWAEVQRALDDPSPGIPHDTVMSETRAIIDRIAGKQILL